jgi:FAD:protein FMN transferase
MQSTRRPLFRGAIGLGLLSVFDLSPTAGRLMAMTDVEAGVLAKRGLHWRSRHLIGFGTQLSLKAAHHDLAVLERGLDDSVVLLRHLESVMSLFQADSQISHLNGHGSLDDADGHLLRIVKLASLVSEASAGAFDITVQPLWLAWAQAQRDGRVPSSKELSLARSKLGWRGLRIDKNALRFERADMAITLNGIAQGYACDQVRALLMERGIGHALLDIGEWSALGDEVMIGIAHPQKPSELLATLGLAGQPHGPDRRQPFLSLATSSDAQTVFTSDRRFHHIFDPQTGASPHLASSVTVLSDSCAIADALTKVFFMSASQSATFDEWAKRSEILCRRWGVGVLIADKAGRQRRL